MKAGTTFLFDLIAKHPTVVFALKGFEFKETACYYNDMIHGDAPHLRMNCFPFIEAHDVSGTHNHLLLLLADKCDDDVVDDLWRWDGLLRSSLRYTTVPKTRESRHQEHHRAS
jgi:hypothetical protein